MLSRRSGGQISRAALPRQQLDVWEHAALLYHAYEWQAAGDAFYSLAHQTGEAQARTLCLLNAGLIQARLGDFQAAATTLEEAVRLNHAILLTAFIVGLVSYEVRDIAKAEACFEICLDVPAGQDVDCSGVGLAFVLKHRLVHENLRVVREAEYRAMVTGSDLAPLNGIPAELIFEAPITLTAGSDRPFPAGSPRGRTDILDFVTGPAHRHAEIAALSTEHTYNTTSVAKRNRPATPYTPRDARAMTGSTKDLANFIRTEGRWQNSSVALQSRRENASQVITSPVTLPSQAISSEHLELLQPTVYRPVCSANQRRKVFEEHNLGTLYQRRRHKRKSCPADELHAGAQGHEGGPVPVTMSAVPAAPPIRLEILQPKLNLPRQHAEHHRQKALYERRRQKIISYPPARLHGNSEEHTGVSSSKATRTQLARNHTLHVLEGRIQPHANKCDSPHTPVLLDKELPPTPDLTSDEGSSGSEYSPGSVDTEDFFDKVLKKGKK